MEKILVIGGGNGGFAAASDLKLRDNYVVLYEIPEFADNIIDIKKVKGIHLEVLQSTNLRGGFAELDLITTDIEKALSLTDIVFIIVPSYAHDVLIDRCAPFIKENHTVILCPGNFGGSINFLQKLREKGNNECKSVSETECMMYACRKKDSQSVWVRGYKHGLGFSTFPAMYNREAFEKVQKIYPFIMFRDNVLETGLSNFNSIVHVPLMLFNLGTINNQYERLMYHEMYTESIDKIISTLDVERLELGEKLGIELLPMRTIVKNWYGHQGAEGETIRNLCKSNPIYAWSKLPETINHRYLTEDIPFGLLPMDSLCNMFNVRNPVMKGIINLASEVLDKGFDDVRDARALNLDKFNQSELKRYVSYFTYNN